eukprot:tig00000241_g20950.t1
MPPAGPSVGPGGEGGAGPSEASPTSIMRRRHSPVEDNGIDHDAASTSSGSTRSSFKRRLSIPAQILAQLQASQHSDVLAWTEQWQKELFSLFESLRDQVDARTTALESANDQLAQERRVRAMVEERAKSTDQHAEELRQEYEEVMARLSEAERRCSALEKESKSLRQAEQSRVSELVSVKLSAERERDMRGDALQKVSELQQEVAVLQCENARLSLELQEMRMPAPTNHMGTPSRRSLQVVATPGTPSAAEAAAAAAEALGTPAKTPMYTPGGSDPAVQSAGLLRARVELSRGELESEREVKRQLVGELGELERALRELKGANEALERDLAALHTARAEATFQRQILEDRLKGEAGAQARLAEGAKALEAELERLRKARAAAEADLRRLKEEATEEERARQHAELACREARAGAADSARRRVEAEREAARARDEAAREEAEAARARERAEGERRRRQAAAELLARGSGSNPGSVKASPASSPMASPCHSRTPSVGLPAGAGPEAEEAQRERRGRQTAEGALAQAQEELAREKSLREIERAARKRAQAELEKERAWRQNAEELRRQLEATLKDATADAAPGPAPKAAPAPEAPAAPQAAAPQAAAGRRGRRGGATRAAAREGVGIVEAPAAAAPAAPAPPSPRRRPPEFFQRVSRAAGEPAGEPQPLASASSARRKLDYDEGRRAARATAPRALLPSGGPAAGTPASRPPASPARREPRSGREAPSLSHSSTQIEALCLFSSSPAPMGLAVGELGAGEHGERLRLLEENSRLRASLASEAVSHLAALADLARSRSELALEKRRRKLVQLEKGEAFAGPAGPSRQAANDGRLDEMIREALDVDFQRIVFTCQLEAEIMKLKMNVKEGAKAISAIQRENGLLRRQMEGLERTKAKLEDENSVLRIAYEFARMRAAAQLQDKARATPGRATPPMGSPGPGALPSSPGSPGAGAAAMVRFTPRFQRGVPEAPSPAEVAWAALEERRVATAADAAVAAATAAAAGTASPRGPGSTRAANRELQCLKAVLAPLLERLRRAETEKREMERALDLQERFCMDMKDIYLDLEEMYETRHGAGAPGPASGLPRDSPRCGGACRGAGVARGPGARAAAYDHKLFQAFRAYQNFLETTLNVRNLKIHSLEKQLETVSHLSPSRRISSLEARDGGPEASHHLELPTSATMIC